MKNVTARTYNSTDYITVAEVKTHLRVTHSSDDTYIGQMLDSCFSHLSNLLGYEVRKSTVAYFFDSLDNGKLHIPARLISLTDIHYRDANGDLQLLAAADYDEILTLSANYGHTVNIINEPTTYDYGWKYKVVVVEGFAKSGDSVDVSKVFPEILRAAIYRMCEDLYTQRGDIMAGANPVLLPINIDHFVSNYQIKEFV